jgi:Histidine kinase-, DNA gyrase B-, and HSP90-like ATPase
MHQADRKLSMRIELTVIEDLGIKLYAQLAPVLSEIIANSWDADATKVDVSIATGELDGNSEISVWDDGIGMTFDQIDALYLRIGRKRREELGTDVSPKFHRPVMGSKGIGKLSAFGVANVLEIETIHAGRRSGFLMVLADILRDARTKGSYEPQVTAYEAPTDHVDGTYVSLKQLKRTSPIDIETIRKRIARHFSVLGENFVVSINGEPITALDKLRPEDIVREWRINDSVDAANPDWRVTGRILATKEPLDERERGVVVMARGKLIQAPTTFEVKTGEKYTYSYLTGEIHAEFFDTTADLISTNRQSVVWESPEGLALMKWGQARLRQISEEWSREKRESRERVIREDPKFKAWLEKLDEPEKKVADKVIGAITGSDVLTDERRADLAKFMMETFDQRVFLEMASALTGSPDDEKLIEFFQKWNVIEAREILRLVKGRLATIEQFEKYVKENALEKPTIHDFFKTWPWMLDPTWTKWQDEVRYSQLLRSKFPDSSLPEKDRRIDFVCVGVGDTINIVELKRPGFKANAISLDQLYEYEIFVRSLLGTDKERGYRSTAGYLVCGELSTDPLTTGKRDTYMNERLYVRRYNDLLVVARRLHAEFEEKLSEFES